MRKVPVTAFYRMNGQVGIRVTHEMEIHKFRPEPELEYWSKVRGPGEEWSNIRGDTLIERDGHGRIARIVVTFDLPDDPMWVNMPERSE